MGSGWFESCLHEPRVVPNYQSGSFRHSFKRRWWWVCSPVNQSSSIGRSLGVWWNWDRNCRFRMGGAGRLSNFLFHLRYYETVGAFMALILWALCSKLYVWAWCRSHYHLNQLCIFLNTKLLKKVHFVETMLTIEVIKIQSMSTFWARRNSSHFRQPAVRRNFFLFC